MSMRRRTVLAVVAGGLSGCLGRSDEAETNSPLTSANATANTTPTVVDQGHDEEEYALIRRSVGESVEVVGGTVTVENPRVRKSVVVDQHTSPVAMHRGVQFVVVDVPHSLRDPDLASRFRVLRDGAPAAGRSAAVRTGAPERLTVAAPAPSLSVDRLGLAWVRGLPDSIVWTLPASIGERLRHEPVFVVHDVARGTEADLTVTFDVENTGDRDGRFNAVVRNTAAADAFDVVSFDVSAGERLATTTTPAVETDPDRAPPLLVEWGTGSRRLGTDG
ncbi:hypothetical protein [Salinigranum salinum]|uniref:hypothetical protein n=1 Tax=Salinigranum salinum TaxID=1364937 RepID=UPI0012607C64|nr:hypothetical protein [Salinigranum salinum]